MADSENLGTCPGCGATLSGSSLMGHEIPELYDGVLIWHHRTCGHRWPRFDAERWPQLHAAAVDHLARAAARKEGEVDL